MAPSIARCPSARKRLFAVDGHEEIRSPRGSGRPSSPGTAARSSGRRRRTRARTRSSGRARRARERRRTAPASSACTATLARPARGQRRGEARAPPGPKSAACAQARAATSAARSKLLALLAADECIGPPPRSSWPPAIRTTEPGGCSARPAAALAGVAASASRMTGGAVDDAERARAAARGPASLRAPGRCRPARRPRAARSRRPAARVSAPGAGGSAATGPRSSAVAREPDGQAPGLDARARIARGAPERAAAGRAPAEPAASATAPGSSALTTVQSPGDLERDDARLGGEVGVQAAVLVDVVGPDVRDAGDLRARPSRPRGGST